jgi:hypothetical protein
VFRNGSICDFEGGGFHTIRFWLFRAPLGAATEGYLRISPETLARNCACRLWLPHFDINADTAPSGFISSTNCDA